MAAWGPTTTGVVAGLLSGTVIPAILAFAWSAGSSGALIDSLGGVSKARMTEILEKNQSVASKAVSPDVVPTAMIAAFDSDVCPAGWEYFSNAGGRFLVGAGKHSNKQVSIYDWRSTGGLENVSLAVAQMPSHKHSYAILEKSGEGLDVDNLTKNISVSPRASETSATGGGQPHENRPPYFAATFCKSVSKIR
ncbi:hypothetical protein [Methylobacterium marchantiae]|uniref:Uncharacterized protein n=1 Tax=Methylobacterium marchantiae TaxID=600331 RepID=A0ABW3X2Q0_9HYPH|nr:hypothetical protein AIGOOFII_2061 [Methylobacterium marchantiae]